MSWPELKIEEASFRTHAWDSRIFLLNTGGSHHFFAAQYIAKKLGVTRKICGSLETLSVNISAVNKALEHYYFFCVSINHQKFDELKDLLLSSKINFCYASSYISNLESSVTIGIPKTDTVLIKIFKRSGFWDYTEYLMEF